MQFTPEELKKLKGKTGYTPQKLGFDKRRPFNLGLHSQNSGILADGGVNSPLKTTEDKYWFKVDGKNVTHEEYKQARKDGVATPGSKNFTDGLGLQTNHPDPFGFKAAHAKNRAKLPKPSTVLTEKQTKIKKQRATKPPFMSKKDFKPHMMYKGKKAVKANTYQKHLELKKQGYGHTPPKNGSPLNYGFLDGVQDTLMAGGLFPAAGNVLDLVNAGISGARSVYSGVTGNKVDMVKHAKNAVLNLSQAVPIAGQATASARLANKAINPVSKLVKKKIKKEASNVAIDEGNKIVQNVKDKSKVKNKLTLLDKKKQKKGIATNNKLT